MKNKNKVNKCKYCGSKKGTVGANFCCSCGKKLKKVCNCPYMRGKYNCKRSKCPGFRVILIKNKQIRRNELKRLSNGEASINQLRKKEGLPELDIPEANNRFKVNQSYSKGE